MAKKREIKIELNAKEEALVHYEMEWGRNCSIRKQAKILYYANQGAASLKKREPRPSINRAHKTKPSKGQLKKDIEKERSTASIGNLISENIASLSEQSQTFGFGDYHRMLCKLIGKIAFRRIGLQL